MGYPLENVLCWESAAFDIGNTGANVAIFVAPVKVRLLRSQCYSNTGVANAFVVSIDSYNGSTQGAEDLGSITVPDSAAAYAVYYDRAGAGVELNAGERALVQVDNAGDSGEKGFVQLVWAYLPEVEDSQADLIESA